MITASVTISRSRSVRAQRRTREKEARRQTIVEAAGAVFDVSGRLVRTLADGTLEAGVHELLWNGDDDQGASAAAGIYFVRMITSAGAETRKVVRLSAR